MSNAPISILDIKATGDEIDKILSAFDPIVDRFPRRVVVIGCITLLCMVIDPEMSIQKLQKMVQETTGWISAAIASTDDDGEFDPSKGN